MKKQTFNRSTILSIAHYLKDKLNETFSQSQKLSWLRTKVVKTLRKGKVRMAYKNGENKIREAFGTLCADFFDYTPKSKGTPKKENWVVVKYWDFERNAFRSFRIDKLVSYVAA